MAKSVTELKALYADLTRNDEAVHVLKGIDNINNAAFRRLYGFDYTFLERTQEILTIQGEKTYPIPIDVTKIRAVSALVGTTQRYVVSNVPTRGDWDQLFYNTLESNIPAWYYIENNTISIYPIPSQDDIPVYLNYKKKMYPATQDDYVTGTLAFTFNSTTVTLTGGTLPTWIPIQGYVTDENGMAYDIVSRDSSTQLTLLQPYRGVTGSQPTLISQGLLFPEGLEYIPLYDAVSDYYLSQEGKKEESRLWKDRADELVAMLNSEFGMKTTNLHIRLSERGDFAQYNPNNYPTI